MKEPLKVLLKKICGLEKEIYFLKEEIASGGEGGCCDIFFDYEDINEMLLDQVNQIDQKIYQVEDASLDPNITFATDISVEPMDPETPDLGDPLGSSKEPIKLPGSGISNGGTKLHAFYRYNGTATGRINDYTLISAPYRNQGGGIQSVTGPNVDNTDPNNPIVNDNDTLPTGLESIDEGNGIGWRLIGRNPDNYGNLGNNAVDFSVSNSTSTTKGATGQRSVVFGLNNTVAAKDSFAAGANNNIQVGQDYSTIFGIGNTINNSGGYNGWTAIIGENNTARGANSTTFGWSNNNLGHSTGNNMTLVSGANIESNVIQGLLVGTGLRGRSISTAVLGQANEENWSSGTIPNNPLNPMLVVGNGEIQPSGNVVSRSDAFVIYKSGKAKFPSLSDTLIDDSGNDSAVTKGWVLSKISGGTGGNVESVTGDNNNVDNTDPDNPIVKSKPLVTADTGTEITLYPFGNFCNSASPNLEDTEFTFVLTNGSEPAGEMATVLIKTAIGATDFPVVTDAEYVEGAPFAVDSYYDLYLWHNGATVSYTFLNRGNWLEPIDINPLIFKVDTSITGAGSSNSTSFKLAQDTRSMPDLMIDWGDGLGFVVCEKSFTPTKDYGVPGIYTIKILGLTTLNGYRGFGITNEAKKIISLEQWGTSTWSNIQEAFSGANNMVYNAIDIPILSDLTDLVSTFKDAFLVDFNPEAWDITNIESMVDMFSGVTLSTPNYDALLIGWASQTVKPNVPFHAGNSKYTAGGAAEAARLVLTSSPNNWVITDGGPV